MSWKHWRRIPEIVRSIKRRDGVTFARHSLTHKSQQVLDLIRRSYPDTVSRRQIINDCWDGNYLVGEKGLNHALWAIRQALGDDARNPRLIRTVSRKGYAWIGPVQNQVKPRSLSRTRPVMAAAATGILVISAFQVQIDIHNSEHSSPSRLSAPDGRSVAYFRGRDIIVEQASERTLVMKPTGEKRFGSPSYSRDGNSLAFPLYDATQCELVVVALLDESYEKFENCPV